MYIILYETIKYLETNIATQHIDLAISKIHSSILSVQPRTPEHLRRMSGQKSLFRERRGGNMTLLSQKSHFRRRGEVCGLSADCPLTPPFDLYKRKPRKVGFVHSPNSGIRFNADPFHRSDVCQTIVLRLAQRHKIQKISPSSVPLESIEQGVRSRSGQNSQRCNSSTGSIFR